MMMARPCVVALLCVALWCGMAFGQEEPAETPADTETEAGASPDQPTDEAAETKSSTTTTTTTSTEDTNAAGGDASPSDGHVEEEAKMEGKEVMVDDEEGDEDEDEDDEEEEVEEDYVENEEVADAEASPSKDDQNGAATMSVSLSSLMIATILAKVYAH